MFQFRFQSLLQLAESQRDAALAAVAEANEAILRVDARRQDIARQRRELVADDRIARVGRVRVESLLAQGRHDRNLAAEDAQLVSAQAQINAELERRRDTLLSADIELKRLEMLKQRDREAWALAAAKADQALMDELAARRTETSPWD